MVSPARFPCCGRAYPCDVCHDEDQDHLMELANRMICGYCAKEQVSGRNSCPADRMRIIFTSIPLNLNITLQIRDKLDRFPAHLNLLALRVQKGMTHILQKTNKNTTFDLMTTMSLICFFGEGFQFPFFPLSIK